MRIRRKAIQVLALTVSLSPLWAQEDRVQTILVHDMAEVPAPVLSGAKAEVTRIFSRARVRIEWRECPESPDAFSARPAGAIILRVVPGTLEFLDKAALGYALLIGRGTLYATVSYTRVKQCFKRQGRSAASLEQVLGNAMAHELGHILLGAGSHSPAGIMRANWDAGQMDDVSKGWLHFSRHEEVRIRDSVAARRELQTAASKPSAQRPGITRSALAK